MTSIGRTIRAALAASVLLAAPGHAQATRGAPLRPPPAPAAAAEPGSELRILVLTMGQGDELWERFGHNGLIIRDDAARTAEVWNWGIFDFAQPNFLGRFLTGDTRYWMAAEDLDTTVQRYRWLNRSLDVQELALTNAQKLAVRDFVRWNSQDDHKFYRYDYYLDNCSTRVRDVIDRALGGALRQALTGRSLPTSYRHETQRLLAGMPLAVFGVTMALGRDADPPLTEWEAAFVPMRLRDALRTVQVRGPDGSMHALVAQEQSLFVASNRAAEAMAPSSMTLALGCGVAGLVLAALLWLLGQAAPASRGARIGLAVAGGAWWGVSGVLGLMLFLAWAVTRHIFWAWNLNLFLLSPLSLVAMVVVPVALLSAHARTMAIGLTRGLALLAIAGTLGVLVPGVGQDSVAVALLALPAHLVLAWAAPRALRAR